MKTMKRIQEIVAHTFACAVFSVISKGPNCIRSELNFK